MSQVDAPCNKSLSLLSCTPTHIVSHSPKSLPLLKQRPAMASNAERGEQQNADQLFEEWLVLSRLKTNFSNKDVNVPEPITKNDALVVIDMQKDFVPASTYNTDGGRFGVDEGEQIVAEICLMIKAASDVGATIIASRDYHPHGGECSNIYVYICMYTYILISMYIYIYPFTYMYTYMCSDDRSRLCVRGLGLVV